MKFVKPYAELLEENNPLIRIEKVGRLCYKSDSEYTEETAVSFVNRLIRNKHYAMLEHTVFTFYCPENTPNIVDFEESYGCVMSNVLNVLNDSPCSPSPHWGQLITCNLRFIIENHLLSFAETIVKEYPIFKKLDDDTFRKASAEKEYKLLNICLIPQDEVFDRFKSSVPHILNHLFLTFHIVCDRGVSHEIVRHRVASYAQESTRYCNYGKDDSLVFIQPCWEMSSEEQANYRKALDMSEEVYTYLVNELKVVPQKARYVLPNGLKTELFMTASVTEYKHFLNLRYFGTTGSPHPQMKEVASYMVDDVFKYTC